MTDSYGNQSVQGTVGNTVFFNQSTLGDTDVSVTGAADEPAGTYDVTLYCEADTSEAYRTDLVAFAAAQ